MDTAGNIVTYTVMGTSYTCQLRRSTLELTTTRSNTTYEPNVDRYLPPPTPKLTKKGTIAKRQPYVEERSASWWRAQCAFRGLPNDGKVDTLQGRIRGHGDKGISPIVKEAFERMKETYMQRIWNTFDNRRKAETLPGEFLRQTFGPGGTDQHNVVVVKVEDWGNSLSAALVSNAFGVTYKVKKMPGSEMGERIMVLGKSSRDVKAKMAEFNEEAEKISQRLEEEEKAREAVAQAQFECEIKLALARSRMSEVRGNWNIDGEWTICSSGIDKCWGTDGKLTMHVCVTKPNHKNRSQVFADFAFKGVEGIFRFVNFPKATKSGTTTANDDKRMRLDDFWFDTTELPSATNKQFKYRWRGEETGEGEIQLYSDEEIYTITFENPDVMHGTFGGSGAGDVRFIGEKTSTITTSVNAAYEWEQRSEATYWSRERSRWR